MTPTHPADSADSADSADPAAGPDTRACVALVVPAVVWAVLIVLLVVAALTPDHFGDPAAPYRLVVYPLLALVLPAIWLLSHSPRPVPGMATTLVMLPFLADTVGNVWGLYGSISWWDDINHVTNWFLLSAGIGLALVDQVRPRWALVVLVVGLGAALAIAWELGEYAVFYDPPYSARLYQDTLGDEALGTTGALVAGLVVALARRTKTQRRG